MKTAIIFAAVLLLLLPSPSRAEEKDHAGTEINERNRNRSSALEKLRKLTVHSPDTESAAYKSDGVDTVSFKPAEILKFHADRVAAFIGADGFGISRRAFPAALPVASVTRQESEGPQTYTASFQELIGIAMHKIPGAYKASYITDTLDEMDKPKSGKIPFRKLDAFEAKAIESLKSGRDLVTDEQPGKLRLVGAIRASADCMACHTCKERDLLGAFTYTLTPPPASAIFKPNHQVPTQVAAPILPPKPPVQQSAEF